MFSFLQIYVHEQNNVAYTFDLDCLYIVVLEEIYFNTEVIKTR